MSNPTPIRAIDYDSPLIDAQPGELAPIFPGDGHFKINDVHLILRRELNFDGNEVWLLIECSCGATFGGAFTRQRLGVAQADRSL